MIYDGKAASLNVQEKLKQDIFKLPRAPRLAILCVATHPSITSFIAIKKRHALVLGVEMTEYNFKEEDGEQIIIEKIQELVDTDACDGIVVQLPLPFTFNTQKILDTIPEYLDVDCLSSKTFDSFNKTGSPLPPVAGAVKYILETNHIDLANKKVVVIGYGNLVGKPVTLYLQHNNVIPSIVDITTSEVEKFKLYKEADIVISGVGLPHHLHKEFFKLGVVLIDGGTSEQAGVLAGDFHPDCRDVASLMTPVPGGVGPLTVAHLFDNLITSFIKNNAK